MDTLLVFGSLSGHITSYIQQVWYPSCSISPPLLQPVCPWILPTVPSYQCLLDVLLPDDRDRQLTSKHNYPHLDEIITSDSNPNHLTSPVLSCPSATKWETFRQPKRTPTPPSLPCSLLAFLTLFPVLLIGTNWLSHLPEQGLYISCVVQYFNLFCIVISTYYIFTNCLISMGDCVSHCHSGFYLNMHFIMLCQLHDFSKRYRVVICHRNTCAYFLGSWHG